MSWLLSIIYSIYFILFLLLIYERFVLFVGKLMSAMLTGLSDRNVAVRKAYASALGHLVKVSN